MIYGVDVSRWNASVDWAALYQRGVRFAGIRATMGATGRDPKYREHRNGAERANIYPISYHLEHCWTRVDVQRRNFLDVAGADAPLAIDVEPVNDQPTCTVEVWRSTTYDLSCELSAVRGYPPLIYGSTAFLTSLNLRCDIAGCPLWIADWRDDDKDLATRPEPRIPRPWRRATIWQTGLAPHDVSATPLDWDRFDGTIDDLHRCLSFID